MAKLTLTMLSDWHVGSGTGVPGNIDKIVRRDSAGFPFIPAKTLTGIWRDACERVALGLDEQNSDGPWHKWVYYLFGDQPAIANKAIETPPQKAALSVRPAHLPASLLTALQNKPQLKEALTFIKPGISIDPNSGCAKPDYLRFEEVVRVGARLEADYSLPDNLKIDSDEYKTAQALLAAGAAMVERLGAKRRRGNGRCQITLDYKLEDALQWIEQHLQPPELPQLGDNTKLHSVGETDTETQKNGDTDNSSSQPNQREWYQLELEITLKSPLLVYKRTVGNVVETLDYLPGTYLLPIIHKYLHQLVHQLGVDVSLAISRGDILVTHATLAIEGTKAKPVPLALFGEKLKKENVYNRLRASQEGKPQLKGYRSGYVGENITALTITTVPLVVETHNTVDDVVQRPTSNVGGVYTYEAIAPETRFIAELRLREDLCKTLNDNWWTCLSGVYQIGRSNKDDYGWVSLEVKGEPTEIKQHFSLLGESKGDLPQEVKGEPTEIKQQPELNKNLLTVWLLSDVLLRNQRLRPTTDIDDFTKALAKELGVTLTLLEQEGVMSHLVRSHRTESWQTHWNLPRPSLLGLQAGTCMVYQVDGDFNPDKLIELQDKLIELQASGMGERRAEGYGQLCFNHPLLTQPSFTLEQSKSNSSQQTANPIPVSDTAAFEYASIIEKEAWREAIRRHAIAKAADETWRKDILGIEIYEENAVKKSKPPMSQLGALRSVLVRLREQKNVSIVTNWLECLKNTDNRKDKWADEESLNLIQRLLTEANLVWELLDLNFDQLTITEQTEANNLKIQLWAEAVNVLVDACIRSHKRACEAQLQQEVTDGKIN